MADRAWDDIGAQVMHELGRWRIRKRLRGCVTCAELHPGLSLSRVPVARVQHRREFHKTAAVFALRSRGGVIRYRGG